MPYRKFHPAAHDACAELAKGNLSRRAFLRRVTLLGLSLPTAHGLLRSITGQGLVRSAAAEPRPGGVLRVAMAVQEMKDPATFDWTEKSNIARHVIEFLSIIGPDNITRPYLAESWEPSEDLTSWRLNLRRGVLWSNGDEFNADDVVFNFQRWLDPATGSSNQSLFGSLLEEFDTGRKDQQGRPVMGRRMATDAVRKIDSHTVQLNLTEPMLALPENLYEYTAGIVHRRFEEEGGDLSRNPVGTGAFQLAEHRVGEIAILRRRSEAYWGGDVYLDEIRYVDVGQDSMASVAALVSGQVDAIYRLDIQTLDAVERVPNLRVHRTESAQTGVMRMKVDKPPFDDLRVRRAVQLAADHEQILQGAHRGLGILGEDHHVAPIHPDYFALPPLKRDVEQARALLAEAGRKELRIDCAVGNTQGTWEQDCVVVLKQNLAEVGIELKVNVMPSAQYWEIWNQAPFGLTAWAHRPLGTMVLGLAYRSGGAWNESGYANPDFDAALAEAEAEIDVERRKAKMEKVQSILQNDAVMVQPFFRSVLTAASDRVQNYHTHPTLVHQFNQVWIG